MTQFITTTSDIHGDFDVAVLDQWGVLHNGAQPYSGASAALIVMHEAGKKLVVLSNSGKRADTNRDRIAKMGLPANLIDHVVTSGEALWQDFAQGKISLGKTGLLRLLPICAAPNDAAVFARGNDSISIMDQGSDFDAILLMGLEEETDGTQHDHLLETALADGKPIICSNPDKASPRAGSLAISPGLLADRFEKSGGKVYWYGKPHLPVFATVKALYPDIPASRFLMVGDSLEHDIAGANGAAFQSLLVRGGLYAKHFANSDNAAKTLNALAEKYATAPPTFSIDELR